MDASQHRKQVWIALCRNRPWRSRASPGDPTTRRGAAVGAACPSV
jgi:hypothetical protein